MLRLMGENMTTRIFRGIVAAILILPVAGALLPAVAQEKPASVESGQFKNLKYRLVGPAAGGRVSRAAGVPAIPLFTMPGPPPEESGSLPMAGIAWKPVFDEQPASSIGSLAVSPSNPNVIYVGTGEANIRGMSLPATVFTDRSMPARHGLMSGSRKGR